MRAKDALRRDTLSGLRAAIKRAEIDARTADAPEVSLDDAQTQSIIEREAKKRRDAIEEYTKANRPDRAEAERAELQILQEFLPAELTDEELELIAQDVQAEGSFQNAKDIGAFMKAMMPRVQGRADGKRVNAIARRMLQ